MNITVSEHTITIHVIAVEGRLEAFTVGDLRAQQTRLLEAGAQNFVIDLSATSFMDSAGMSALVSLLKRARQVNGDVVLVTPQDPAAHRILTLTRFDQVFTLAASRDDALKHFKG